MSDEKKCGQCGAPLSSTAPEGLCPACLLKRGFDTQTAGGNPDFTPPSPEELARYFPELEILELLGRGGMGVVYKARQRDLDRIVALKILPSTADRDPAFAERFAREARALARLSHPNIVTIYESGQVEGLYYFVMEFVDGLNLRQVLASGKMKPREALAIVPQICEALQTAHDQGIVHRDIKPENILLDKKGRVKIADFGIAKIVGADGQDMTLTGAGQMMGTPAYMAPEQIEHPQDVDHRADIYSLGVVFYQMLTGELPLGKFGPPSSRAGGVQIDVRIDEVVLRALEKQPELRFQQASEVKTQVETIAATGTRPGGAPLVDTGRLNRVRGWTLFYCALMAAGAVVMGRNITPSQYGVVVGSWGVSFFIAAAVLAFLSRGNIEKVNALRQVALIDSLGILLAVIKCAFMTPGLPGTWMIPIVAASGYGLVSGLFSLASWPPFRSQIFANVPLTAGFTDRSDSKPSHARFAGIALFFSALSGLLAWAAWWIANSQDSIPSAILLWSTLAAAALGILPAIPARKHWWGKLALIVGIINANAAIWMLPLTHPGNIPVLVQDDTEKIYPDGNGHYSVTSSAVNRSSTPVDTQTFNMSGNFPDIQITDTNGRRLHTTRTAVGWNLYHYDVALIDPVPPGGRITTITDGAIGGLIHSTGTPGEFVYAFDHSPGYDGMTQRLETYKLPPGAELIEKSPDDFQVTTVGDHIELHLEKMIPPGGHLEVSFRYRLADAEPNSSARSILQAIPAIQPADQSRVPSGQVIANYGLQSLPVPDPAHANTEIEDGRQVLKIHNDTDAALQLSICKIVKPPVTAMHYALTGQIHYEDVRGAGYLEMWSYFPPAQPGGQEAQYFSRTLGEPSSGPMAQIAGTSSWRTFTLPFDRTGTASPPDRLEFNIFLPGKGAVTIGPFQLTQIPDSTSAGDVRDTESQEIPAIKLDEAISVAARAEQNYKVGLIPEAEYDAATDAVEILKAELTGDAVQVARTQLDAAQRQVDAMSKTYKEGVTTEADYAKARTDLEIAEVRLRIAEAAKGEQAAGASPSPATAQPAGDTAAAPAPSPAPKPPKLLAEMLFADVPADFTPTPENMTPDRLRQVPGTHITNMPTVIMANGRMAQILSFDKPVPPGNPGPMDIQSPGMKLNLLPVLDGESVRYTLKASFTSSSSTNSAVTKDQLMTGIVALGKLAVFDLRWADVPYRSVVSVKFTRIDATGEPPGAGK